MSDFDHDELELIARYRQQTMRLRKLSRWINRLNRGETK